MTSLDCELVSSTLPYEIYLGKRCNDVVATFVPNEPTATFQKSTRALTKRCCNVWYYPFSILKKHIYNNWISTYFCIICLIYNDLTSLDWEPCHLHSHTNYIWSNVDTTLVQRLSQASSVKLSSNIIFRSLRLVVGVAAKIMHSYWNIPIC